MANEFTLTIERDESFDCFQIEGAALKVVEEILATFLVGNYFDNTEIEWDVFEVMYIEALDTYSSNVGLVNADPNDDILTAASFIADKLHTYLNELEIKKCQLINLSMLQNGDIDCELQVG